MVSKIQHQKYNIKKKKEKKKERKQQINWISPRLKTCPSKDTSKKVKRQSKEWKKIFAIHVYLEYIKNSFNSVTKRQHNLKMGKGSE